MRKRCYKNCNEEEFRQRVRELSWYDIYLCEDLDQAVQLLTNKITSLLDQVAPVRTIQTRTRYAPWLSKETKASMKTRDTAQKQAADTQHPDDWRLYKNLRNTVTARMRSEKSAWEKQRLDHAQNTSSNLWNNIKGWLNHHLSYFQMEYWSTLQRAWPVPWTGSSSTRWTDSGKASLTATMIHCKY